MVVEYTYDAYGNLLTTSDTSGASLGVNNPFRYRGYYYDGETGLYYLNSRYYNPHWGRFINVDSILGQVGGLLTHNLFAYCNNNPVIYKDSSGYIIEIAAFATEEEKKAYEAAIAYLKQSETAKALIEMLENSDETITITFNDNDDDSYERSTNIIYWDIDSGLILGDEKSIQSAALGLVHEMGHASQDINGLQIFSYIEREADNLINCETPIANELGEFTRKDYLDAIGVVTMRNSTDWGTKNSHAAFGYSVPWNCGGKYYYATK